MKGIHVIQKKYKLLLALAITLVFANCGTVDNFDSDAFNLAGENKKGTNQFRRYSENPIVQPPIIEFVLDNDDDLSVNFNSNLKKVCDYTKLPYKITDINRWDASPEISSSTRVLCMTSTIKLSDASINAITEFVVNGGTFFLPIGVEDKRLAYLLGFRPEALFYTDITAKGFYLKSPMLPNFNGKKINPNELHYGYAKENFSNKVRILATAVNDPAFPTITKNKVGKGSVVLFNSQKDLKKRDRGLLFSGIMEGLEGIPYPVANVSTIFLDDFPCPLFDIKSEPIASEMGLSAKDFVKKVWWPDMVKLGKKYNIDYSVMLTFDYKNKVEPPFTFDQWDKNKIKSGPNVESLSDWFVKDAAKHGHELSFHGYNHVELIKGLWKNKDFIGTSLKSVQKRWEVSDFGQLPVTYVPPSNFIDNMGIDELKKGMPFLKYMCSSYDGVTSEGENREFDFDPYNKDFFDFPRITSGYHLNVSQQYSQQSTYLFTGIWTHFVHPDDVYQVNTMKNHTQGEFDYRNALNLGWYKTRGKKIGMYSEFDNYLKEMTTLFPQMRFLSAGEAANIVLDWRASNFNHKTENGLYTVEELKPEESISGKQYWFVYISSENVQKMEAAIKNQAVRFSRTPYLDGYLYSVYTNTSKLTLPDLNYKTADQKMQLDELLKNVKADILVHEAKAKKFLEDLTGETWVDEDMKSKVEIEKLKQKIQTEAKIDPAAWNKYAKYMISEDKAVDVWKALENHCLQYPLPENIMYSKQLNTIIEYPNDLSKEKWLEAQILVTPNDKDLLNSYVASFYTPENQAKIKSALVNLLKIDTGTDTYLQYIQYLLTYEPQNAIAELDKEQPSEKLKSLATDIAWLYADNNLFQKAYDWSAYSNDIDFAIRMSWLVELKSFKVLESEYKNYIAKNGTDYKALSVLSSINHEIGKFKEAWVLANSLPENTEKENLRAMLNKDVMYVDVSIQQDLIQNYPDLFYPDVKDALIKADRKENGDYITLASGLESNRTDPSAFKNLVGYSLHDRHKNIHTLAATFSKMYRIDVEIEDPDNVTHTIYGLQYQFNNPKNYDKLQYWGRVRGEYSDFDKFYIHAGIGANYSKNKWYRSLEIKLFPAETGPAYSKSIYRLQGTLYQDAYFFNLFNASLSLEANYYTYSISKTVAKTSDSYEASSTAKIIWDNGKEKKSKFLPFVEASYSESSIGKATLNPSSGYPYWMIDSRFYMGGGLGWKVGKEESNFNSRLEAAWFYDDYSGDFKRFMGEIAYQIFDYTAITGAFEVYSQSEFYSNVLRVGLKYNLKKRQKK